MEPHLGYFHVAGVLVHAAPSRAHDVSAKVASLPGAWVHASSPTGTLVVTLESEDPRFILEALSGLQRMEGVLSAVLVSEQSEPLSTADEVLADDPQDTP